MMGAVRVSDQQATCPQCGGAWFELHGEDWIPKHGAVVLDRRGMVTGFAGEPCCVECGTPAFGGGTRRRVKRRRRPMPPPPPCNVVQMRPRLG